MRDILVFSMVFGSLPFILWRPWIGILVWSWLAYMNPHRLTWGFAFDFPFSQVVALTLIAALLISREPKRIPVTGVTIVWLLFFIHTWITMQFAFAPVDAAAEWSRWWRICLVSAITIMLMGNRYRLNCLIWVIVVSLGFYGVKGGIYTIVTGSDYQVWGPPRSFIAGNNGLALALIMLLPLVRYLHLQSKNLWVRMGLIGAMVLITFSIFGSHSRGALVGVAALGLAMIWKSRNRVSISIAGLLLIPLIWSFMPQHWHERMGTIQTYEEDGSAMGRINAWWMAVNLAKDRPLIGGGFRTFGPTQFLKYAPDPEDAHDAHSIFFEVLGEHGFPGITLFLLLAFLAFRNGSWVIRKARDGPEDLHWAGDLASMIQVSIFGYMAAGAFLGLAYFDLYYTLIVMMVLVKAEVQKVLADEPQQTELDQPAYRNSGTGLSGGDLPTASWSR